MPLSTLAPFALVLVIGIVVLYAVYRGRSLSVARRPRAPSCGSRNQISGIDSSARRARCCRRSELIVHHGAENVAGNHLKGRYRRGRSGVTSMRLSLWIGFGHLTWIKFKAATYELSCWLLRDGPRYCRCRPVERHAEAVDASTSNKESRHGDTSHRPICGYASQRRCNAKQFG